MNPDNPQRSRSSGVLLHVTALPSPYGIGDLGPGAYEFVDFLEGAGQKNWQILPLNPTSPVMGHSPYSSFSSKALNPLIISPDLLIEKGIVRRNEVLELPIQQESAEFAAAASMKDSMFSRAFDVYMAGEKRREFEEFCEKHREWLDDHALFKVLDSCFPWRIWTLWPEPLRDRVPSAIAEFSKRHERVLLREKFIQFLAFDQWNALRRYANSKGVALIGDLPLYPSQHSVDVWSARRLFKLDAKGEPTHVAGVPPDYFCEDGQLWGNPVYDWEKHEKDGFAWWTSRIRHNLELCDWLRVDHFRGFVAYWEVPASEKSAKNGQWVQVPFDKFFAALRREAGRPNLIAEDLGIITDAVRDAMKRQELPGMKVMIFAFHNEEPNNPYLPYNIAYNSVVYTGTHDNNTVKGWFDNEATAKEKELFKKYARTGVPAGQNWDMIRLAMSTSARLVIIPIQDVLGLGEEARFNVPGTAEGNWGWRLVWKDRNRVKSELRGVTREYGRL